MRRKRLELGDIYEIALPNGKNAYGRLCKSYNLAIYKGIYDSVDELDLDDEDYEFFVCVYKDLLQDGEWRIVGNKKFENEEDACPPPKRVVCPFTKIGSLYYKGEITPCTYEECKDLENVVVWSRASVVDRLMGGDLWKKCLREPLDPNDYEGIQLAIENLMKAFKKSKDEASELMSKKMAIYTSVATLKPV